MDTQLLTKEAFIGQSVQDIVGECCPNCPKQGEIPRMKNRHLVYGPLHFQTRNPGNQVGESFTNHTNYCRSAYRLSVNGVQRSQLDFTLYIYCIYIILLIFVSVFLHTRNVRGFAPLPSQFILRVWGENEGSCCGEV